MNNFRLHRPKKEEPESGWHRKTRRWRVLACGCFGIFVSSFIGWKLLTDTRGTIEARVVGWIIVPIAFGVCVRLVVLCFRKKEDDPFYAEVERDAE